MVPVAIYSKHPQSSVANTLTSLADLSEIISQVLEGSERAMTETLVLERIIQVARTTPAMMISIPS